MHIFVYKLYVASYISINERSITVLVFNGNKNAVSVLKHQAWFLENAFFKGKRHDTFCDNSLMVWISSAGNTENDLKQTLSEHDKPVYCIVASKMYWKKTAVNWGEFWHIKDTEISNFNSELRVT